MAMDKERGTLIAVKEVKIKTRQEAEQAEQFQKEISIMERLR